MAAAAGLGRGTGPAGDHQIQPAISIGIDEGGTGPDRIHDVVQVVTGQGVPDMDAGGPGHIGETTAARRGQGCRRRLRLDGCRGTGGSGALRRRGASLPTRAQHSGGGEAEDGNGGMCCS